MPGFKMLVQGVEAGGKGEFPTFLWGLTIGEGTGVLAIGELVAAPVLPEGQGSSSDPSRQWCRPAGYRGCFDLAVSAGSAVGSTFRALEETAAAAGLVSAPGLGDGG